MRKIIMAGFATLPLLLNSCSSDIPYIRQLKGTVQSDKRTSEWYQISLGDHNTSTLSYGDTLEIRFYGSESQLKEWDTKINPGTELVLSARKVRRRGSPDYEFIAEGIDSIK